MHSPALKTRAIWPKNGGGKAVERKCRYQPHCMQYHGQWELSPNHLPVTQMLQLDLILKYTWKSQGPRRAEQGLKNNEVDGSALPDGSTPYPRVCPAGWEHAVPQSSWEAEAQTPAQDRAAATGAGPARRAEETAAPGEQRRVRPPTHTRQQLQGKHCLTMIHVFFCKKV